MGKVDVLKETTPLSSEDCFLVMQRPKSGFNFPLHVHMEFELNYLENAAGAIRIVGDSVEEIDDMDLVLSREERSMLTRTISVRVMGSLR